jgi:hypothetical protein
MWVIKVILGHHTSYLTRNKAGIQGFADNASDANVTQYKTKGDATKEANWFAMWNQWADGKSIKAEAVRA